MSLFDELKRRNVFRVGAAYLALGWIITQVTATVTPMMRLPEWVAPTVLWIGVIGFPFVLLFSWVYELTPEGLKRESEIARDSSITNLTARRLDAVIIAMLAVAMLLFVADRFLPRAPAVGAGLPANEFAAKAAPTGPAEFAAKAAPTGPATEPASVAPAPDAKSIAVLPFVNMSSDKEQEYFSDGISEELLNLLAKIPELKVIARTSSFAYKGKEAKIADVARELNVAHVLEGSVRKSGNKVRITAQLVRASDSMHLWSQTFDRALDDIFAVQDEIAAAVVDQLKIKLLGAAPKTRVVNPEAYALVLRARQLGRQFTVEGWKQSTPLYEQALAIDPGYAEAWRGIAANYINEVAYGLRPIDEGFRLGREAIGKALAIDPDFARAHDGLAWIAMTYDHDLAAAAAHFQHALAIEPGNLDIIGNAANLMIRLGRVEQAIAIGEWGIERDPLDVIGRANLAAFYLAADRYDDAIRVSRELLGLSPGFLGAQIGMGEALMRKGDNAAALAAMKAEPDEASRLLGVAEAQYALGNASESDLALQALIAKFADSQTVSIATVYAFRQDLDQAFEWLARAERNNDPGLGGSVISWQMRALREDPRWLPFARRVGIAPEQLAAIPFEVNLPE